MKRRLSLTEEANLTADKRRNRQEEAEKIKEEGWELLDSKYSRLALNSVHSTQDCFALFSDLSNSSTKAEVFLAMMPVAVVEASLSARLEEDNGAFMLKDGGGYVANLTADKKLVFEYFAVRIFIQGMQKRAGGKVDEAVKAAADYINENMDRESEKKDRKKIAGLTRLRRMQQVFFVAVGEEEKALCDAWQCCLSRLGEVLCGDEKLFKFTAQSGIVRQVPSKPAKIGVWHYQAAVFLENNSPLLVFTRCHNVSKKMDMSITTAEVIGDWLAVIDKFGHPSILIFDSYYLSLAGRRKILQRGSKVIGALKPDRFQSLFDYVSPSVTESGQTAYAFNNDTKEACVYHWSMEKDVGKKMVYTTAFKKESKRKVKFGIPVYDTYKAGFSGCDAFNKAMHNRTWPFRSSGKNGRADSMNCFNYLFTCCLINTWHAFCVLQRKNPNDVPFDIFCKELAVDVANHVSGW